MDTHAGHNDAMARSRRSRPSLLIRVAEAALVVALAHTAAGVFWSGMAAGSSIPVGVQQPTQDTPAALASRTADLGVLTAYDVFQRGIALGSSEAETVSPAAGDAPVTALNLVLTGQRVSSDPRKGSAIIRTPDGAERTYWPDDEVMPGVYLTGVYADRVLLEHNGRTESLIAEERPPLFSDRAVQGEELASVSIEGVAPEAAAADSEPTPEADLRGLSNADERDPDQTSARGGAADLAGEDITIEMGSLTELMGAISLTPDGAGGVMLSPKGDGAAFRALGFQPNDRLISINGSRFSSDIDMLTAFEELRKQSRFDIEVERNGARFHRNVWIVEE